MTDEDFLINIENMFASLSFEDNSDENFAAVRMKLDSLSNALSKIEKTINMLINSFSKLLEAIEGQSVTQEEAVPEEPKKEAPVLGYKEFVKVLSDMNYAAIDKERAISVMAKFVDPEFKNQPLNHIKPENYADCLSELHREFNS